MHVIMSLTHTHITHICIHEYKYKYKSYTRNMHILCYYLLQAAPGSKIAAELGFQGVTLPALTLTNQPYPNQP